MLVRAARSRVSAARRPVRARISSRTNGLRTSARTYFRGPAHMRDLLSISNYVKEVGEEAITNEFQSLRSSGKKLDIHKYNEVLAAKVFKGDVGEITEVVNTIIQDGVTPNNTTTRLLTFFFNRTDNYGKGESLLSKLAHLDKVPKNVVNDIISLGRKEELEAFEQRLPHLFAEEALKQRGEMELWQDYMNDEAKQFYGAWHAVMNDASAENVNAVVSAINNLTKAVDETAPEFFKRIGIPESAFEDVDVDPKKFKEDVAAGVNKVFASLPESARAEIIKQQTSNIPKKQKRVTGEFKALFDKFEQDAKVAKELTAPLLERLQNYLLSQPYQRGALPTNFSELFALQRMYSNTHGEVNNYLNALHLLSVANLMFQGIPEITNPDALVHPLVDIPNALKGESTPLKKELLNNYTTQPLIEDHYAFFESYRASVGELRQY